MLRKAEFNTEFDDDVNRKRCIGLSPAAKLVAEKEREENRRELIGSTGSWCVDLPERTALHYANLLRSYSTAIRARGHQ